MKSKGEMNMNINLQFNNLKELDSFIKAMGYSKLAAQPEEAEEGRTKGRT